MPEIKYKKGDIRSFIKTILSKDSKDSNKVELKKRIEKLTENLSKETNLPSISDRMTSG